LRGEVRKPLEKKGKRNGSEKVPTGAAKGLRFVAWICEEGKKEIIQEKPDLSTAIGKSSTEGEKKKERGEKEERKSKKDDEIRPLLIFSTYSPSRKRRKKGGKGEGKKEIWAQGDKAFNSFFNFLRLPAILVRRIEMGKKKKEKEEGRTSR